MGGFVKQLKMGELHIGPKRDLVNSIRWSFIEVGLPACFLDMLWSQEVPRITSISRMTRSIVLRLLVVLLWSLLADKPSEILCSRLSTSLDCGVSRWLVRPTEGSVESLALLCLLAVCCQIFLIRFFWLGGRRRRAWARRACLTMDPGDIFIFILSRRGAVPNLSYAQRYWEFVLMQAKSIFGHDSPRYHQCVYQVATNSRYIGRTAVVRRGDLHRGGLARRWSEHQREYAAHKRGTVSKSRKRTRYFILSQGSAVSLHMMALLFAVGAEAPAQEAARITLGPPECNNVRSVPGCGRHRWRCARDAGHSRSRLGQSERHRKRLAESFDDEMCDNGLTGRRTFNICCSYNEAIEMQETINLMRLWPMQPFRAMYSELLDRSVVSTDCDGPLNILDRKYSWALVSYAGWKPLSVDWGLVLRHWQAPCDTLYQIWDMARMLPRYIPRSKAMGPITGFLDVLLFVLPGRIVTSVFCKNQSAVWFLNLGMVEKCRFTPNVFDRNTALRRLVADLSGRAARRHQLRLGPFECQYAFALDVCDLLLDGHSLSLICEAWHSCSVDPKARRLGIGVIHIFKQHRARHVLVHNAPLIIMNTLPQSLESCRAVVRRLVFTTPPTASTLSKHCCEMGWGNGKGQQPLQWLVQRVLEGRQRQWEPASLPALCQSSKAIGCLCSAEKS